MKEGVLRDLERFAGLQTQQACAITHSCCARFWLDMVKFSTASAWFTAACRSAAVAWVIWFSASAVSWLLLTLLAYADVGAKPLSHSLFCSARRAVLNSAHVRCGSLRQCHSRMAKGNRWDCEISPVAVVRVSNQSKVVLMLLPYGGSIQGC